MRAHPPRATRRLPLALLPLLWGAAGCQRGSVSDANCPLPGDLVITEVFANPPGADAGGEWFEITNITANPIDLSGMRFRVTRRDGSAEKRHTVTDLVLEPGAYVAAGDVAPDALPAHLGYGYGDDLGALTNTGGTVAVLCGATEIDVVTYEDAPEGASLALDGGSAPDAVRNDAPENWCTAEVEYAPGLRGTPGSANPACFGPDLCNDQGTLRPPRLANVGDLVITEIMANPAAAADTTGEWVELLVNADVDLNGLIVANWQTGDSQRLSDPTCLSVSAGTRLVLARSMDPAENGGLPRVDHLLSIGLPNYGGLLVVAHGEAEDAAGWEQGPAGVAASLDPGATDPDANDDAANWCEATTPYGDGDLGTPGDPNPSCGGGTEGTCLENGTPRPVAPPGPGDLVIAEVMADPAAVADADGEWFEVVARADVDLNGLGIGATADAISTTVASADCIRAAAGTRIVFVRNPDAAANGGVSNDAYTFDVSLTNAAGSLALVAAGATVDAVTWTQAPTGAALSLDPSAEDAQANDDAANWCAATTPYGDGDLGTPGDPNPPCAGGDTCLEGGMPRPVVAPGPGDLVIAEVMANPAAAADADGEWFEVVARADVDLNGLVLGADIAMPAETIASADCLAVAAGDRILFARNGDPLQNGGLPVPDRLFGFSLVNNGGSLQIGSGGVLVDGVTWTAAASGVALSLDPAAEDAQANDDPNNWCDATAPYGDGDLGTPKAANPPCPSADTCIDDGMPRPVVAPQVGDLVITEVMPNPAAVADSAGEWFEVLVTNDVDLNGLELGADIMAPSTTLTDANCLSVTAGTRLLFARNADPLQNGGLPAVDHIFGFSLVNTNGTLQIGVGGMLLDAVSWPSSNAGAAWQVDPASEDPVANDTFTNWCAATQPYGDGDLGTPKAAGVPCM